VRRGLGGAAARPGPGCRPPRALLTVPNVTAPHQRPVNVLLYDGPLLCGFNVAIKGLNIINYHDSW